MLRRMALAVSATGRLRVASADPLGAAGNCDYSKYPSSSSRASVGM